MIDIHSHIIPGVDDGAKLMAEAILMLEEATKAGVSTIIATPHYSKELHKNVLMERNFGLLANEAQKHEINLLKGYEIKIQNYPVQMPNDYSDLTLGDSRYVLMELPLDRLPSYTFDLLYNIQLAGMIPIMAHPERCRKLYSESLLIDELVDSSCLLQVDAASIIGINGRKAKKLAKKLIISGNASFIASDAHDHKGYSEWYVKAYKKVCKWVGRQKAEELFKHNPSIILGKPANMAAIET